MTTAGGTARSAVFFQVTTLPTGGPVGGPIIRGPIGGGLAGGRIPGGDLPDQGPGF